MNVSITDLHKPASYGSGGRPLNDLARATLLPSKGRMLVLKYRRRPCSRAHRRLLIGSTT